MTQTITLIEGDGIGPEISAQVVRVLQALQLPLTFDRQTLGQTALEQTGSLIPEATLQSIRKNHIALKAPCTTPVGQGFRSVNVQLRLAFDLYANIRPARSLEGVKTRYENVDLIIFRENTEDLYIGEERKIDEDTVEAIKRITRPASQRIIQAAFDYAAAHQRKKVTCVHKANILKQSDGLFLRIFREIAAQYPQIEATDLIVDNACMQMVMHPEQFDVMVMPNLYGDILSDLSSGLIGGLGLLPGVNRNEEIAIFEAVHGSAPDIAGKNLANPTALLQSACMMLDYLGYGDAAQRIHKALVSVLCDTPVRTRDLGGTATTTAFTDALIARL